MDFDRWFFRIVGIATILGCILQGWAVYRIEAPKPLPASTAPGAPPALLLVLLAPIISGTLILTAAFVLSRTKKVQHSTFSVDSAKWYCTRVKKAQRNVTREVQGMVRENGLLVHAHDSVFGDVCKDHYGAGDPKTLEIDLTYHLHIAATHDGWINLCGPQIGPEHQGQFPPVPIRDNQELRQQIDNLRAELAKSQNSAHGWLKETEKKTLELQQANTQLSLMQNDLVKQQDFLGGRIRFLESDEYRNFWKWIGTVHDLAVDADKLNVKLEEVWHLWNNSGEKLLHPLHSGVIAEAPEPLPWNQRQLLEFRILYRRHITDADTIDPTFESNLIIEGFPCDGVGQEYLLVRRKIEAHAGLLREHAARHIREFRASNGI